MKFSSSSFPQAKSRPGTADDAEPARLEPEQGAGAGGRVQEGPDAGGPHQGPREDARRHNESFPVAASLTINDVGKEVSEFDRDESKRRSWMS